MANRISYLKYFLYFLLLTVLITVADWIFLGRPSIGIDDANIFFNYARHFSNGQGFVFNSGGEKVEGFTSMLWVLICSFFYKLSSSPESLILLFLIGITAYTITLVYLEVSEDMQQFRHLITGKGFMAIYTVFIIAIGPSFMVWSVLSLMENALWNLLFAITVIIIMRGFRRASILTSEKIVLLITGGLMLLTRPEAIAWIVFFTLLLIIINIRSRSGYIFPAIYLLLTGGVAFSLIKFRLNYFGYPLPNTYYAKVSGNRIYNLLQGIEYIFGFVVTYNPVITFLLTVLLIHLFFSLFRNRLLSRLTKAGDAGELFMTRTAIVTCTICSAILLVCITGGDHFGGFRFYQGIILLLAWGIPAFVWICSRYVNGYSKMWSLYLFSGIAFFLMLTGLNSLFAVKKIALTHISYEFSLASQGRELAQQLNSCWPEKVKPSAGIIAVGGFSLIYTGETVDLMGLNNTLMGHSKGDRIGFKNHAAFNKDIFYRLHPDLVLPKSVTDERAANLTYFELLNKGNFENQALKDIFNDPEFIRNYQPVMITGASGSIRIFTFINKNALYVMEKDPRVSITRLKGLLI